VSVGAGKVKLLDRQLISNKKAAKDLEQTGAILIAHWGLTGPAVLKLSAWAARILAESDYHATLQVNWLPQFSLETCRQQLIATKAEVPRRAIANFRPFTEISQRLWQYLVARAEIPSQLNWADLSQKAIQALTTQLLQSEYAIVGKGIFKEEFVTCGGVNLDQVDFKTMESRLCPGLYFAGEILDIDGVTGGFNFQSAWTTGYLAGMAIAC
jgi:predicted Rossmann fold flavoprotein